MDCYKLFGFVGILRESIKVLSKNGKLMAFITTLSLLYSLLFFCNIFFTKSLIGDLLIRKNQLLVVNRRSSAFVSLLVGIIKDIRILLVVESAFILAYLMVILFSTTAITYQGGKDSLSRVGRPFIWSVITWFQVTILEIGYMTSFVLAILIPLLIIVDRPFASKGIFIVLGILALIFCIYLTVVWSLALVISVIEENCYGKAQGLVKGKRLHGFALNFLSLLLFVIISQGFRITTAKQSMIIVELFMINSIFLLKIIKLIAYTVFYFQCKKIHGQEIELEYSKIPTKPLAEDIP